MVEALGVGLLLGLSAGLAPGPLLALVVAQTLRHGLGHGVRVALAPLLTDVPIVLGCVLLVGVLPTTGAVPALVAVVGGGFVAYLAVETWRSAAAGLEEADDVPTSSAWIRGATVNFLSPHPYLFWLAIGAPTLLAAVARDGAAGGAGFLLGFYGGLCGSKIAIAVGVARARRFVGGRGYRIVLRVLGVALAAFAVLLLREAWVLIGG